MRKEVAIVIPLLGIMIIIAIMLIEQIVQNPVLALIAIGLFYRELKKRKPK